MDKITLEIKQWAAYHNEWGYACGRFSTHFWDTKEEVEEWIKDNKPSWGKYVALPYLPGHELFKIMYK